MKVCFVGAGSIGQRHIRNLCEIAHRREMELTIHLLKSTDRPLDEDIRRRIGHIADSWDKLDRHYDAVFITNPTHLHYRTLKTAYAFSDSFFIEKPVFDNVDADISPFDRPDKKSYVACPLRYTGVLLEAERIVRSEAVLSARAISSSYLPDWRKGTDYRKTYSAHREQGGGVRLDIIHEWDYLTALFGFPEKVRSFSGTYSALEIDSEDLAVYIAQYPGKIVELHLDYFGRSRTRTLELRTDRHLYEFDLVHQTIRTDGMISAQLEEDLNEMYLREMDHFIQFCNGAEPSGNDIRHALDVMKTALQ